MKEAGSRIIIDKLLSDSRWTLPGDDGKVNVELEVSNKKGVADYVLMDSSGFPVCVIEAKRELKSPLDGKEQARGYADALNCRFIILSNGVNHYQWDIEQGSPFVIDQFPSQKQLELRKEKFNPPVEEDELISNNYIGVTQHPHFGKDPDYLDESKRSDFLTRNKIRLLRDYQLDAVHAVQKKIQSGNDRFLLEMATGTGKTLTSCAIIKMFLRLYKVNRVLFLVDRLELETQAQKEFDEVLKNDFRTVVWKDNQSDWKKAEIVVSTVQSFVSKNKYKKVFNHDDFDLVISDEAHRSLGQRSRRVFEYFNGFKLGLTATPRNFLRSVDVDKLGEKDPRGLEKRFMLDTYMTFGCESGEPTFRYSLEDGVKDGYLVNPKVLDARTEITTELLSEEGYFFEGVDEDGNDVEETYLKKDFEKRFFSDTTNTIFCETFLKKAKKDPYTSEIGKTLIFCVSQKHASKITHILNVLADKLFPNQYRSDFAVQVTSSVENSQRMTMDFRNNSLNGQSKINENYRTSKTRVCVTVGMMTTGYDCTDILNLCLMRPVYSPSEFIQMKGRGTRKNDFKFHWISPKEIPEHIVSVKENFNLFDFFGNYEYFEKDFDYDEILKLPQKPSIPLEDPSENDITEVINYNDDPLKFIEEISIGDEGMKIDRNLYRSFQAVITEDSTVRNFVDNMEFEKAENYLKENILDKPKEFFTIEKLRKSLELDRKLSVSELLLYAYGHLDRIKNKNECLEEEFEKFDNEFNLTPDAFNNVKEVFESYALDSQYRKIIDEKKLVELNVHYPGAGEVYKNIPSELRDKIPQFIREKVNLERLSNA
jgi:type I restriction enzyme, R subunit